MYTKQQLESLKNSLLASGQPDKITADKHRQFEQAVINELYDAQARANLIAQIDTALSLSDGDKVVTISNGVAKLIDADLFGSGGEGGGTGEANTASNLGVVGEGIFSSKLGVDLRFKRIVAGTNVTLSSDANTITINSSGVAADQEYQEFANLAAFPATGTTDILYVAIDTNRIYRWTGSVYVELSAGSVTGSLDSLTDVVITTPTNGQVLKFDGVNWVNGTDTVGTGGTTTNPLDLPEIAQPSAPPADVARIYSRDVNGITALEYMSSTGFIARVLRDSLFIARNESGSTITKGTPVYISGVFTGGEIVPVVAPARANALTTMPCVGLAAQDITNNGFGRVLVEGRIDNINTSSFSTNTRLFVSSATAGVLTSTQPGPPNLDQRVALVIRSHATLGSILVDTKTMLGELQGTITNSFSIGDGLAGNKTIIANNADGTKPALRYNDTSNVWEFSNNGTTFSAFGAGTVETTWQSPTFGATTTLDLQSKYENAFEYTATGNTTLAFANVPADLTKKLYILLNVKYNGITSHTITLPGGSHNKKGDAITSITLSTDTTGNVETIEVLRRPDGTFEWYWDEGGASTGDVVGVTPVTYGSTINLDLANRQLWTWTYTATASHTLNLSNAKSGSGHDFFITMSGITSITITLGGTGLTYRRLDTGGVITFFTKTVVSGRTYLFGAKVVGTTIWLTGL